jgi:hypothetical protein
MGKLAMIEVSREVTTLRPSSALSTVPHQFVVTSRVHLSTPPALAGGASISELQQQTITV